MPAHLFRRNARRSAILAAAALALPGNLVLAVDGTWKVDNVGNWSTPTNWTSEPAVPNGVGDTARFLVAISAGRAITQDVPGLTLGAIVIDDDNPYTIAGTNAITLDAAGAGSNAAVTFGAANGVVSHVIATDLVLNDGVTVTTNPSFALPQTFGGVISGPGGLVKTGIGTLVLRGATANTFTGDTVVNQGTLDLFKTAANTVAIGGNLIVGDDVGGVNVDVAITKNGAIPTTSTVTVNSSGQFQIAAADAIGALTLKGGSVTVAGGGAFFSVQGDITTQAHANAASISGVGNLLLQSGHLINVADGAADADLVISNVISQGGINKQGAGTLVLTNNNSYPQPTTISAGTLQVGNGGMAGTIGGGALTNNGTFAFNRSNALVVGHTINGAGGIAQIGAGTTTLTANNGYTGATVITAGTLQIGSGTVSGTLGSGPVTNNAILAFNRSDALAVPNDISGSGGILKTGAGTTTLSGALAYGGVTRVQVGRLVIDTNLATQASIDVVNNATLELASNGTKRRFINTPELTLAAAARIDLKDNKLFTTMPIGTFTGGAYGGIQGLVARAYNFGAWDQPGLTTSMPEAGFNAGPLSGTTTIGVATAEQVMFIGPSDTGVFQGQTVTGATTIAMYTYAGDLNLDGLVDGADYGVIDNYVQFPGTDGYVNGDFNYDGVIDGADYGVIDNTIQLQGAPFPGVVFGATAVTSSVTAVPEPSACGLAILGAAAAALRSRRRRRTR